MKSDTTTTIYFDYDRGKLDDETLLNLYKLMMNKGYSKNFIDNLVIIKVTFMYSTRK